MFDIGVYAYLRTLFYKITESWVERAFSDSLPDNCEQCGIPGYEDVIYKTYPHTRSDQNQIRQYLHYGQIFQSTLNVELCFEICQALMLYFYGDFVSRRKRTNCFTISL